MISGLTEVSMDSFIKKRVLLENEFVVDYTSGIVQFNQINEGKTFVVSYYGRGLIVIAASRIYAMIQRNPDIIITLQDYIDELKMYIQQLDLKIEETLAAIENANQAADRANTSADNANLATDDALKATEEAKKAAESTIVIRKDPVDNYDDLFSTYPSPENGWQVTINSTADIYRYSSQSGMWELVGNYLGGSIPYASESTDGIVRKEDYKNFITRTAFFSIPKILSQGVQPIGLCKLPFDGELISAQAYCVDSGIINPTDIAIEKISEEDLLNGIGVWDNIFSSNLLISAGEMFSSGGIIADIAARKDDLLRVNISQYDNSIKGITIQLNIKTVN